MRTIYYYGIDNNYGGMEKFAFSVISSVLNNSKNVKFHILTEFENFAFKDVLINKYNCEFTILPNKLKYPFSYFKKISSIFKNAKSNDLIHLNLMSYRNFLLLEAIKKHKIKTIIFGHSCGGKFNFLHFFCKNYYKKIGYKIALNKETARYMFAKNRCDYFLPNSVDFEKFKFNENYRNEIRSKYNIDDNTLLIGQIGRICNQKNQSFSIDVVKNITVSKKFFIIGKMIDNKQVKNIDQKTIKLFNEQDVLKFYSAFDVLLMPSKFEGLSLAMLEALASGLTVVCSNKIPFLENCNGVVYLPLRKNRWFSYLNSFEKANNRNNPLPINYSSGIWIKEILRIYNNEELF